MRPETPATFGLLGRPYARDGAAAVLPWLLEPSKRARTLHVANVHTAMSAFWDPALALAQAQASLSIPDGRPLSLAGKLLGCWEARALRGPDLMRLAAEAGQAKGCRHYYYGAAPGVARAAAERLKALAPRLKAVGAESPPYRDLSDAELKRLVARLRRLKVDLLWVGLGAPKQEKLMHRLAQLKAPCTMIGVGAAFDLYAGRTAEAPRWMQALALEWAYRLWAEPGRLLGRYLSTNPPFLLLLALETAGLYGGRSALERIGRLACAAALGLALARGQWAWALGSCSALLAWGRLSYRLDEEERSQP